MQKCGIGARLKNESPAAALGEKVEPPTEESREAAIEGKQENRFLDSLRSLRMTFKIFSTKQGQIWKRAITKAPMRLLAMTTRTAIIICAAIAG